MKYFKLVLLCLLTLIEEYLSADDDTCNVRLLSSYGLKGIVNPVFGSVVCPMVTQTCCSKEDELYIHKYYNMFLAGAFIQRYTKLNDVLNDVGTLIQQVAAVNFTIIAQFFANIQFCNNISDSINLASGVISTINTTDVVSMFPDLTTNLTKIFKRIGKLREGFFCTLCDLRTQSSVDVNEQQIVYSKSFCSSLVMLGFDSFYYKFSNIYGLLVQYNQILNVTLNQTLFTPDDLAEVNSILWALEKCAGTTGTKDCTLFCNLFLLNENSLMFDGDTSTLQNAIDTSAGLIGTLQAPPTMDAYMLMINYTVSMADTSAGIAPPTNKSGFNALMTNSSQSCSNTSYVFNAENCINCTNCTNIINCRNCPNCTNCTSVPRGTPTTCPPRGLSDGPKGILGSIGSAISSGVSGLVGGATRLFGGQNRRLYDENGKVVLNTSGQQVTNYEQTQADFLDNGLDSQFHPSGAQPINPSRTLSETSLNQYPPQPNFELGNNSNELSQNQLGDRLAINHISPQSPIKTDQRVFQSQPPHGRILNERIVMAEPTDVRFNGKYFEIPEDSKQKSEVDKYVERSLVSLRESQKEQDSSKYAYYDVDENGKPTAGPFETEFDENLPSGSPLRRPRLLFFGGLKNLVGGAINAVKNVVKSVVGGGDNNNDNFTWEIIPAVPAPPRPPRIPPTPTLLTDPVVIGNPQPDQPRVTGVDFFATFADRNVSLSIFGTSIDVIGTYQQNLNMSNFIPDPDTTEQCKIYPVRINPISLSNYTYSVSPGDSGVNPFESSSDNFFSIKAEDLIAQLFKGDARYVAKMPELSSSVVALMEASNKEEIMRFLTDYTRGYSPFNQAQPLPHVIEFYPRELSGLSVVEIAVMALMVLIFYEK